MLQPGVLQRVPASLKDAAVACQRPLPPAGAAFQALCASRASPLSPLFYAYTQLFVGPSSPSAVNVTISSIAVLDPATGALGAAAAGAAPAAPTYAPPSAPGGAAVCGGVVARADILVRYTMDAATGATLIASASAALVVTDVSEGAGALRQEASVSWADAAAPAAALLPLSGAPGYLEGFPVLAGVTETLAGKTAVRRLVGGLALPAAAAGGACAPPPAGPAGAGAAVRFGYNATSACARRMTAAELAALCAAGDAAAAARAAAGALLDAAAAGTMVVGVWGDSRAAAAAEWVPIAVAGRWPPPAPTWNAAERRCDGVVTGFELKLVTGAAASAANLQRKVLFAQLCPTLGSWAYDARAAAVAGAAAQAFPLRFAARFAAIDQGAPAARLRPAPPLAVPLPPDLFYPFL